MSHATLMVIAPAGTTDIEAHLNEVMAPFDENLEGEARQDDCYCKGWEARNRADKQASKEFDPKFAAIREKHKNKYDKNEMEAEFAKMQAREAELLAADPDKDKVNPECEDCHGTGEVTTTYNEQSKWDWYQVGGRWSGLFNETTRKKGFHCDVPAAISKQTEHKEGNVATGAEVKAILKAEPDFGTFAILTKDGRWAQKGQLGWGSVHSKDKSYKDVAKEIINGLADDDVCILVDYHI